MSSRVVYRPHLHQHAPTPATNCSACPVVRPLPKSWRRAASKPTHSLSPDQERSQFFIKKLDCPVEERLIRKKLNALPQVSSLRFNLIKQLVTVEHKRGERNTVMAALQEVGMAAIALSDDTLTPESPPASQHHPLRLLLPFLLALAAEIGHWFEFSPLLTMLPALAAIALCGLDTFRKGWIAIRHGECNINALMSVAVSGALLIGEWPEAAMVMVLFNLAERIESHSLQRARHAIHDLLALAPDFAWRRQPDGQWQQTPCTQVQVHDLLQARPGERIAADGIVTNGESALNQAPITGESLPVDKSPGDTVFAGSINCHGTLEYRVTATANHSTLARIIHAVEDAQASRAPVQRFIDRFARLYTPVVVALAAMLACLPPLLGQQQWLEAIYTALTLLIIACPCALLISIPVSIVSALTAASRLGILIKGGAFLEQGQKLTCLAMDKTGTLTHGKPQRTNTIAWHHPEPAPDCAALWAASLAAHSDHPVSQALAKAAREQDNIIVLLPVTAFEALPGRGVSAMVDGKHLFLGNHRLVEDLGVCSPALEETLFAWEQQGKSVIVLCDAQRVYWLAAVADAIKPSSASAIAALQRLGVRTLLLSGDNPHSVAAVAQTLGIDQAHGNQLPENKQTAIRAQQQQGEVVGMVGDGINDAPALASADIGFAMGAAGSHTAIDTADVTLMDDDPGKLVSFIMLSRCTHRILLQNVTLALGIKALFLLLAFSGHTSLWLAVFADVGTSLLVVANGLRLLRFRAAS